MTGTVVAENVGDGVCVVTLNRPQRLNAIVPELLEDLIAALDAADRDPGVRAIVLTGAGRAFCSGDDLKDFGSQAGDEASTRAYIERIQDVTRTMTLGDTPVVGAIRGWAVGGGLEWVINCDFTVAAAGTRFFFPEVSWGVFVTGGEASSPDHARGALRCGAGPCLGPSVESGERRRPHAASPCARPTHRCPAAGSGT